MAQVGTSMGNFIYIDTSGGNDYKKQMTESFGQCLSMAIEGSQKNKIKIESRADPKFKKNLMLKYRYVFEEKEKPDDEKDMQIEED